MSDSLTSFPKLGDIFQERYRLDKVIGQGGYARVYRAHQLDLGRDVAIKILRNQGRSAQQAEEAARRFEREAKLVSQLRDPHTITVFDSGRTESGGLYMVTEFVEGRNLLDFIADHGALSPQRATAMILGVLYSLEEAHHRGILHRDIKPANVMVYELRGRPDQVKLLDFGIAKAFDDGAEESASMSAALTGQGRVVGSPGYMSPEQIRGESLAPRSDLYSVGLVFYEMLTGTRAIVADDLRAAFRQMDEFPILLPADLAIPDEFREIVHRMIRKTPDERFQSAQDVIQALLEATSSATAPPPQPVAIELQAQNNYLYLAIAALIVAAIAAGAFLLNL